MRAGVSADSYRENTVYESLYEALDSLPEIYRQVITLRYLGGMSSREIARFLGTSPTAIRKRLSRARAQLREDMVAMMGTAFEGQRLQASFTFRVIETVRRIKINPMPRATALPWGLSLAAGIIFTVMSLGQHLTMSNSMSVPAGSPLPAKMKALKTGEIPVDILDVSQISVIARKQGDGKDGALKPSDQQKALHLAPAANGDRWEPKADMPTARCRFSSSAVNGKIYAIGGRGAEPVSLPTVEEYDPAADRWTRKADMPTARANISTSVVNGKIYVFGGGWLSLAVEEYDPVTDIWTTKADMPTQRADGLTTSVVDGKIYAIGGWDGVRFVSTVEEYDPVVDRWTSKADMPTARNSLSSVAVNGRIYAIGGWNDLWALSTVEEYNPATDTWKKKANMPTARESFGASSVNGKIYAIGGKGLGLAHFATVEQYDPVADKWTRKADMPMAREWMSASVVDGKIYAVGGGGGGAILSTVEEYTPEGWSSQRPVSTQGKLPTTWGTVKRNRDTKIQ